MGSLIDGVLHASPWAVLGVVALLVFAEDALFVGFVIPGETAALLGGVAARLGHVSLTEVAAAVVVAAIVGDTVGYEIGRHVGPRMLSWPVLDKRRKRLDDAQDFLARRGGSAVFLGRWVAFFRAVMPALAGASRMRYPKFLAWNATGGLLWGVAVVVAGYLAGASYRRVEHYLGTGAALVVAVIAVVVVIVWRVRRHRAEAADHPRG